MKTGWVNPGLIGDNQSPYFGPKATAGDNDNGNNDSSSVNGGSGGVCSGGQTNKGANSSKKQHRGSLYVDEVAISNVVTMVCFATALMENLARINRGKCDVWSGALAF